MSQEKHSLLHKLATNPKRIFLYDAFGALLTAFSLVAILAQLEQYFGMPQETLFLLAGIAIGLFIYSLSCHRFIKSKWKPFLRILIICNAAYLLISLGMVIKHSETLTALGWLYFILEFIVIGVIIRIEYHTFSNLSRS